MLVEFVSNPDFNFLTSFGQQFGIPVVGDTLRIPPALGVGFIRKVELGPAFKLLIHHYTLHEDFVLKRRPAEQPFNLALKLNAPQARINMINDFEAAAKHGVQTAGNAQGGNATVLSELAQLIGTGKLELIVASTYPLEEVRAAYDELEARHTHGKIVLLLN